MSFFSYMTSFTLNIRQADSIIYSNTINSFFAASNKAAAVDWKALRKIRYFFLLQSFCDVIPPGDYLDSFS